LPDAGGPGFLTLNGRIGEANRSLIGPNRSLSAFNGLPESGRRQIVLRHRAHPTRSRRAEEPFAAAPFHVAGRDRSLCSMRAFAQATCARVLARVGSLAERTGHATRSDDSLGTDETRLGT